jgi:hypothetical protein
MHEFWRSMALSSEASIGACVHEMLITIVSLNTLALNI